MAAYHRSNSKLVTYFTVNTPFVKYMDKIDNLTDSLEFPIQKDKTTFEQTLPISLNICKFDIFLLTAPKTLKDYSPVQIQERIFYLEEWNDNTDKNLPNKNCFPNNFIVDIFLFIAAIILLLVTTLAIYLLCKHEKLRMLVASLALQKVREVGTATIQEDVIMTCSCKI